jgi:hypothetical protein
MQGLADSTTSMHTLPSRTTSLQSVIMSDNPQDKDVSRDGRYLEEVDFAAEGLVMPTTLNNLSTIQPDFPQTIPIPQLSDNMNAVVQEYARQNISPTTFDNVRRLSRELPNKFQASPVHRGNVLMSYFAIS